MGKVGGLAMTGRPTALPVRPEAVPQELRQLKRWVMWRYVSRRKPDGSQVWAKLPMTVDGKAASSTDARTWTTFDDVADALILGGFDGIGVVLGDGWHGIDLDECRDPVLGELTDLAQEFLSRVAGYAEVSPSGTGLKLIGRTNLDASRTKKEAGVECYVDSRYFTVTGHTINGHVAVAPAVQDVGWLVEKVWAEQLQAGGGAGVGDSEGVALELYRAPLEDWSLERVVAEVLPHLDPDSGYADWLQVGAALHHQGQGDGDWLQAWDDWSAGSGKWAAGVCEEKWSSFSAQRFKGKGAITLASLLKKTKEARETAAVQQRDATVQGLLAEIAAVSAAGDLESAVAPKVSKLKSLLDTEREQLAQAMQAKAKELGLPLAISVVRGWLRYRAGSALWPGGVAGGGGDGGPEWARDWVYLTGGDKFFNLRSKAEVTVTGFRAMFNRLMPMDRDGNREKADQAALEVWGMPVVDHKAYMPGVGDVFEMFGRRWVNLYRPESAPAVPGDADLTDEDREAVRVVEQHFAVMFEDKRERRLLLSWLAHNIQKVGVKIRWAPYIHGVPGDGKSFFADLLASAMGGQNVTPLNAKVLESSFNEWAIGAAVVAIEEMKQHGHSRYDVMNGVKPLITNDTVNIHPKGKAAYSAPNVTNYIVFSNYLDGAPVDATDRRYMFLSSSVTVDAAKKLTATGYFKRLFDAVRQHPGAMRKWLMGVLLDREFDANGRAPDTRIKATVVEMSKSELDTAIEDVLENGAEGVTKDVLSSSHFTAAIKARGVEPPATKAVKTTLGNLGFEFLGRERWAGDMRNIWVRRGLNFKKDQALAILSRAGVESDFLSSQTSV